MVFFAPHTWTQNELITHDELNVELRDQLIEMQSRILALETSLAAVQTAQNSILAGWVTYTPQIQASVASPLIGSGGVATGAYKKMGKTVFGWGSWNFGTSGYNKGSGNYYMTLPVAPAARSAWQMVGNGYIWQNRTSILYTTVNRITGTRLEMLHTSTLGRWATTADLPLSYGASDGLLWNFTYESAA